MSKAISSGLPEPAVRSGQITLRFDGKDDADTVTNLSSSVRTGTSLFLGADEACTIERLSISGKSAADHRRFALRDFLDLKDPDEEADIEGLAVRDDWLWITGSHARTRPNPAKRDDETIDIKKLADLRDTRPRCLLARLPLVPDGSGWQPVRKDGKRRAGMIAQNKHGSALAKALGKDPLLAPFAHVPAKEGGIDVEGIAVAGDRVALGLRGPVICGNAVLIELKIDARKSGRLHLDGPPARRLLDLEGLGIRDLKRSGDDLLILAGPTTTLSGPCALYRWRDWANDPVADQHHVRVHRPDRVIDLPFGRLCDHPEGLALWDDEGTQILVICDSPAPERLGKDGKAIKADLFRIAGIA